MRPDLLSLAPELSALPADVYLVGGAVRDFLLGRVPNDFDLASPPGSASIIARDFAKRINGRLVELGRDRFTTLRVVAGDAEFDFSDLQGSLDDDLARRDATVNAMAIELQKPGVLIDQHGGEEDLRARRLRMIREQNFIDDPLRVVKLIRMAAVLEFSIEPATFEAMRRHGPALPKVAMERIDAELETIFQAGRAFAAVELARAVGLDQILFGRTVDDADIELLQRLGGDSATVWSALAHGDIEAFARAHKWPTARLRDVNVIQRTVDAIRNVDGEAERVVILYDAGALNAQRVSNFLDAAGDGTVAAAVKALLAERGSGLFQTTTLLSGDEIASATGLTPGPELGRRKRALLEAQLRGEVKSVEKAREFVRRGGS
jgi:tRNA nucleotidyltransferase/poly(A) polymerase